MPRRSTTNSWPFPPETREVQVDEKWGFVYQKEASCDPTDPLDRLRGDDWDHTAVDPESRLLLALVPGKRDGAACERLIRQVHDRTGGRTDLLIDQRRARPVRDGDPGGLRHRAPRPRRPGPGRPPKPVKVLPAGPVLRDGAEAAREGPRGGGGADPGLRHAVRCCGALLERSTVSTTINTSFVERNNGTDRHQNSRKRRKTYALLEGDGDAPGGLLLHRIQLQLLLAGADAASPGRRGALARPDTGDGRGIE